MKKTGMRRGPLVVRPADHRGDFFRVLQETERSQTAVMTVAPGQDAGPEETHAADQILYVPATDWILQPILAILPLQLLAYHVARLKGLNVDQPRNLAKTVTVE